MSSLTRKNSVREQYAEFADKTGYEMTETQQWKMVSSPLTKRSRKCGHYRK